jgi:hypothetical protein
MTRDSLPPIEFIADGSAFAPRADEIMTNGTFSVPL